MKIIAVNGSPRKTWNTAKLLTSALEGAASQGAETALFHLYELNFKGCVSCFSCKLDGGGSYGRCAVKDGLTPLLETISACDALIVGSPIYLGEVTGEMRSFYERLAFPYLVYDKTHSSLFTRKLPVGFIYTMNVDAAHLPMTDYAVHFGGTEGLMAHIFGASESMLVTDTLQFDDYSKYVGDLFDPAAKAARHRDVFPRQLQNAFEMGKRFAAK